MTRKASYYQWAPGAQPVIATYDAGTMTLLAVSTDAEAAKRHISDRRHILPYRNCFSIAAAEITPALCYRIYRDGLKGRKVRELDDGRLCTYEEWRREQAAKWAKLSPAASTPDVRNKETGGGSHYSDPSDLVVRRALKNLRKSIRKGS